MSDSLAIPWIVACQAPLFMRFPKQEHWSGLPFASLRDLPDPVIESRSLNWQAGSLPLSHQSIEPESGLKCLYPQSMKNVP